MCVSVRWGAVACFCPGQRMLQLFSNDPFERVQSLMLIHQTKFSFIKYGWVYKCYFPIQSIGNYTLLIQNK